MKQRLTLFINNEEVVTRARMTAGAKNISLSELVEQILDAALPPLKTFEEITVNIVNYGDKKKKK